ncbi:hypothetical protein FACS1894130_00830 [Spirochaetia bacterium]|nr:hypothetical protein FACS1894130_00830 [Spirochaetia bacterium]
MPEFARDVMSTIPSIFSNTMPSYTAVGGTERAASTGLSAILLTRGGRYPRRTLFQELEKSGFDYIIAIEGPQERYDLEELSGRFPFVRFILLKEAISPGEQINLAVSELSGPLFFVLWNDLRILHSGGAARMAERLFCSAEELKAGNKGPNKRLCTVPVIQNSHFETLPTLIAPAIFRGTVKPVLFSSTKEGAPTLYPFDGVGLYDRDRFVKMGGFDSTLKNTHWQLMDFGFRSHLWGEEIQATQLVRLSYNGEAPPHDSTAEESYRRFYLKNLAPVFRGDNAHLPIRRFFSYLFRSGGDPFQAWAEFAEARRWVKTNCYRFRCDAKALTGLWDNPGGEHAGSGTAFSSGSSAAAEKKPSVSGETSPSFNAILSPDITDKPPSGIAVEPSPDITAEVSPGETPQPEGQADESPVIKSRDDEIPELVPAQLPPKECV